jgi:hypothetical protein
MCIHCRCLATIRDIYIYIYRLMGGIYPVWRRVRMPPLWLCELWEAREREPSARGYNWATLFLGDVNGDLALQVGRVSGIGTVQYGLSSSGTRTRAGLRWRGPAATVNYSPGFSSDRALQKLQTGNCLKKISR